MEHKDLNDQAAAGVARVRLVVGVQDERGEHMEPGHTYSVSPGFGLILVNEGRAVPATDEAPPPAAKPRATSRKKRA